MQYYSPVLSKHDNATLYNQPHSRNTSRQCNINGIADSLLVPNTV